uniref:WW domain-containing protein n=1 Tax=Cucumis melo TaxID=3656 RepID=A0A9I9CGZ0_CUCME
LQTVVQKPFISTSKACPQLDSSLAVIANPIVHIISKPFSPLPNTHIHKVNQNYKRYLSLPLPLPLLSFSLCKSKMKRKWEDPQGENFNSPTDNIELHLETPLPLEWQRCLDIQSGEIHFFNTKTQKRTSMDPRRNKLEGPTTTPSRSHVSDHQALSLDLELNLNCQSNKKILSNNNDDTGGLMKLQANNYGISCPWLRFEREQQEMVARVCMQCHLLVMLLKSSPTCPNCKFIHPITDHHQYLQNNPPTTTTTTTTFFLPNSLPTENDNNHHHQTESLKSFFPNPIQNKV